MQEFYNKNDTPLSIGIRPRDSNRWAMFDIHDEAA